jgi:cytochrome o ubiquinol oxidase operon protein cyoD
MSVHEDADPLMHPEVQQSSVFGYLSGYAVTVLLLLLSMYITIAHMLPPIPLLGVLSGLALVILIAQAFLFFGLDFSQHHIWKSLSIILTVPLFILSIGLTVWMFHSLDGLTMMPDMPGMSMQPTLLQ